MTLLRLYARSRLVVPAAAALVIATIAAAVADSHHAPLIRALVPLLAALIVIGTVTSPDADWERTLPTRWWSVRCGHAVAGIAAATAILCCAFPDAHNIRDLLGFTGLAAVTAVVMGAGRSWMVLLPYALLAGRLADPDHAQSWAWFARPGSDPGSWWIAAGAAAVGVAALARYGARSSQITGE